MKQSYLKSLLLLLAMVWAIPKSTAADYEISAPTNVWTKAYTGTSSNWVSSAVVGDVIYTAPGYSATPTDIFYSATFSSEPTTRWVSKGHYIDNTNGGKAFSYGSWTDPDGTAASTSNCYYSAGPSIASDADGALWLKAKLSSSWGPVQNATAFIYYSAGNTPNPFATTGAAGTKTAVSLGTQDLTGRADRMTAYGHTTTAAGGALWIIPNGYTSIVKFPVVSGVIQTKVDYSLPSGITVASNNRIVTQYADNKIMFDDGTSLYKGVISGTNVTWTKIGVTANAGNNSTGAAIFELQGHEVVVYSSSATQISFYDITTGAMLGTATPFTTQGSSEYGRHGIHAKVSGNTASVYVYVPGQGAAKYSITATEVANFTDPVQNLKATRTFNTDASQDAMLTWSAPATGADYVTGYTIYKDGATVTTVAAGTTTYTYAGLTASSEFNVVPNYNYNGTVTVGTDSKVTIAPYVYTAPQNVNAEHYSGYARASISFTKISRTTGIEILYDIVRDGTVISKGLSQNEYIDTYIPEGEHTYAVEAVYYIADADGKYTIEIKRMRSGGKTLLIDELNTANVNYTLEEVYNYEMWDIWNADQANGKKLPANFNPNLKTDKGYIDAEHYRQGALVTDSNGKKWWYIAQKSNTTNFEAHDGGTSGGVLKISAENADLQAGGNASLLDLSTAGEIKVGQTAGIAADANGNFLVRGWNQTYDDAGTTSYNDGMNYGSKLVNVVIYSADLTKRFEVPLNFDLDADDVQTNQYSNGRIDYYRVSGDLMGTSYLYVVCGASRTFSVIKMVNDGTNVTASLEKQYTPDTIGDTGETIKVSAGDGYENYAFDIESGQGSAGYVYQKRSVGYLYVPTAATSNTAIFTEDGKLANSGGTTVRMVNANDSAATRLFIITPQSFLSRNTGSFSVELVTGNDFANGTVPIATKVQDASDNVIATSEAGNANGNWLFAEYNATDKCIYIYQYVPGIRIAKYRLYGNVGFLDSKPTLDITTSYDANKENITHFTATTSWSTPTDYKGAGDYAISHYKVELLDAANKVIDSKDVKATEGYGTDWSSKDYSLTFNTTADITPATGVTVATGDTENHFVDNASPYTARVTAVYDLTSVLNGTSGADSDLRSGAVRSVQTTHDYGVKNPAGEVTIYEGVGTVNNVYRIEINIENMEEGEEPVSHYEIAYNYTDASGKKVTVPVDNFVLVTADALTEGQSVVPGADVRNGNNGYALSESQGKSFVCFYQDNRVLEDTNKDGHLDYTYPTEENWQIPSNWTYTITAVYAANNSLLRNTTAVTLNAPDTMIETGVESVGGDAAASLNAFPIPATSTLTVQAPQGIESISIISAAGVEVKSVAGNSESIMSIAVDDLAAGYYMLRVNGLAPIKIVKK
ncbi:MAG: T9SS type A sorting domain-containing protein [Muribaculaceae bacterium]|nr:T9SS type A sorting domain-containing protein [Muribaculaceae bacterium]